MNSDTILINIIKECYWDYNVDINDLKTILSSHCMHEKRKLFSKIIYNSNDKILSLHIFPKEQLKEFFDDFKVTYNEKYIYRHLQVLKSLLLDNKLEIEGLSWKKR